MNVSSVGREAQEGVGRKLKTFEGEASCPLVPLVVMNGELKGAE